MTEKGRATETVEKKTEEANNNRPENPFAAQDLQTGKIDRPKDPQAERGLLNFGDSTQKPPLTPEQMAGSIMEGKQGLDKLAQGKGVKPGDAGWNDFVKGLNNNPLDNADRKDSFVKAIQAAYKNDGINGVDKLINDANEKVVGPFGPTININDKMMATLSLKAQTDDGQLHDIAKPVTFKLDANDKPVLTGKLTKDVDPAPIASGYGLTKAFSELSKLAPGEWTPKSDTQQKALKFISENKGDLDKIPPNMLDALASKDHNALNKFLKDKGYSIELKPMQGDGVGVVTSIEVEGKWAAKNFAPIKVGDKEYPAFQKKTDEIYQVAGRKEPVVKLYEQDGIRVYATPYDGNLNGLDATDVASKLSPENNPKVQNPDGYTHVVMPKVDMNRVSELNWLKGMTNSSGHQIDQALAQAMVQMDEKGFKAKEGLAIATSRSVVRDTEKNLTMDKPFLFWIEKDGVKQPLYATKIDQQYWKAPEKK